MAKTRLFDPWTWKRHLPDPFNSVKTKRTDICSIHNTSPEKESTLHTPTICAILAYIDLDIAESSGGSAKGAIGTQGNIVITEYPSHTGKLHVSVFNKETGKFSAGIFENALSSPDPYTLKADGESGSALFFALMPAAMEDGEFIDAYMKFRESKRNGYPDFNEAVKQAAVLCDNFYRRIENADNLGAAGIKINISNVGNIPTLTALNLSKGVYYPTDITYGKYEILKPGETGSKPGIDIKNSEFEGSYRLSEREFGEKEKKRIPKLPDWYIIPPEVVTVCKHIKMTTNSNSEMRNFMFRGESGAGKTEGAKAIAAGLGLPYVYYTCSSASEISDLLGQYLPDEETGRKSLSTANPGKNGYPSLNDIQMDPASAYYTLTGIYNEQITADDVYRKLLETIYNNALAEQRDGRQKLRYVDTALVNAIRYGWVCEIQEPSVIANSGVLVGLNSLMDKCNCVTLPTGECIERHRDTVIIVTTNNNYYGCKNINQSVISRMNLVFDIEEPDIETLIKRVTGITKCGDKNMVRRMAESMKEISKSCRELMITDGCCGTRELISWIQSYMICGSAYEAADYTILSSLSNDKENRDSIRSKYIKTKYAA